MKRNEVINFARQYKNSVCLDESLKPVKLVESFEDDDGIMGFKVLSVDGVVSPSYRVIALRGRLKERDYNFIDSTFYKELHPLDK